MMDEPRMVEVDRVCRGGGMIVAMLAALSLLATILSGAIIIQPMVAILLLIFGAGFFVMSFLPVAITKK